MNYQILLTGDDVEFTSNGEGVGMWIQLDFDQGYNISRLRIQQRANPVELSRGLELSFSDGSTQNVRVKLLVCYKGPGLQTFFNIGGYEMRL